MAKKKEDVVDTAKAVANKVVKAVKDKVAQVANDDATKEAVEAVKEATEKVAKAVKQAAETIADGDYVTAKIPEGPLAEKWNNYKAHQKLVNPANKRRLDVIVVGTGLAGASAAASLGELGFNVLNFCIQDSPRRAHSIAAQGLFIVYSMILSKVVTIVLVSQMYIVWLKCRIVSSTNVWLKVFLLLANTVVCSITVRLVVRKFRVHSMLKDKLVNSCY